MKATQAYTRYRQVRRWSTFPMDHYRVENTNFSLSSPVDCVGSDTAAWNIFWAIALRRDVNSEELPIVLLRLPAVAEQNLLKLPSFGLTLIEGGSVWTLAAWMCKLSPEQFMEQFWSRIAVMLTLPEERGHLFSK